MRRAMIAVLTLSVLSGCRYISFGRRQSEQAILLQQEIRSYYNDVQRAFAAGNAQALASLFNPSITHPMTYAQIQAWGDKFFGEHGPSRFVIESLEFDALGPMKAEVLMKYRVVTRDGKGDFSGTELDRLVQKRGRWYIASWDPLKQ